jgi:hypothetical protein
MTPSMRPPSRWTRRAAQEDRHRRPQQQRLLQSLTRSSTRTKNHRSCAFLNSKERPPHIIRIGKSFSIFDWKCPLTRVILYGAFWWEMYLLVAIKLPRSWSIRGLQLRGCKTDFLALMIHAQDSRYEAPAVRHYELLKYLKALHNLAAERSWTSRRFHSPWRATSSLKKTVFRVPKKDVMFACDSTFSDVDEFSERRESTRNSRDNSWCV